LNRAVSDHPGAEGATPEGYADDAVPWAMQIVVRVEKSPAPAHSAVLRAVASAVALALVAFTGPEAPPDVRRSTERWRSGPIRKVVRRARGAGWTRQLAVPGVFVHRAYGVDVAVHVPGRVDEVDPEIARLQVGGLVLTDPDRPGQEPGPSPADVQLYLNPHVALTTGKAAAQAAHAAQLVLQSLGPDEAAAWTSAGAPLQVSQAPEGDWENLLQTAPVVVADGGFTEVAPGTITVAATYPWESVSRS
jgi:peptidyl-tRNA hydrolase